MEGKGSAVAVSGGSCAGPICRQGTSRPLLVIFNLNLNLNFFLFFFKKKLSLFFVN